MLPRYTPVVKREPTRRRTTKTWTSDAGDALQGALECTDWDVFVNSSDSLDELVDVTTCYINFCTDNVLSEKTIKIYANSKPWITGDIIKAINDKKRAFREGDKTKCKNAQKQLNKIIRSGKDAYKKKLDENFTKNNMKKVWDGMKLMSSYSAKTKQSASPVDPNNSKDRANKLNEFYCRFDCIYFK